MLPLVCCSKEKRKSIKNRNYLITLPVVVVVIGTQVIDDCCDVN